MAKMTFSQALRTVRMLRGLTLKNIADTVGLNISTIHRYEKESHITPVNRINELCSLLDIKQEGDSFIVDVINTEYRRLMDEYSKCAPVMSLQEFFGVTKSTLPIKDQVRLYARMIAEIDQESVYRYNEQDDTLIDETL